MISVLRDTKRRHGYRGGGQARRDSGSGLMPPLGKEADGHPKLEEARQDSPLKQQGRAALPTL